MKFPVCVGATVKLRGRDLAGGGRLFFWSSCLNTAFVVGVIGTGRLYFVTSF